jgi:hypothetical protein
MLYSLGLKTGPQPAVGIPEMKIPPYGALVIVESWFVALSLPNRNAALCHCFDML